MTELQILSLRMPSDMENFINGKIKDGWFISKTDMLRFVINYCLCRKDITLCLSRFTENAKSPDNKNTSVKLPLRIHQRINGICKEFDLTKTSFVLSCLDYYKSDIEQRLFGN